MFNSNLLKLYHDDRSTYDEVFGKNNKMLVSDEELQNSVNTLSQSSSTTNTTLNVIKTTNDDINSKLATTVSLLSQPLATNATIQASNTPLQINGGNTDDVNVNVTNGTLYTNDESIYNFLLHEQHFFIKHNLLQGNVYNVSYNDKQLSSSNTQQHLFSLFNPVDSGKNIYIYKFLFSSTKVINDMPSGENFTYYYNGNTSNDNGATNASAGDIYTDDIFNEFTQIRINKLISPPTGDAITQSTTMAVTNKKFSSLNTTTLTILENPVIESTYSSPYVTTSITTLNPTSKISFKDDYICISEGTGIMLSVLTNHNSYFNSNVFFIEL